MNTEELELLSELGLTISEAKVYLALVEIGPSSAEKVAEASKIARERVYILMPILRQKGIIHEIISTPKKFAALPFENVIRDLIAKEKDRTKVHVEKAREITKRHAELFSENQRTKRLEHEFDISILPLGKTIPLTVSKMTREAKMTADLTITKRNMIYSVEHFPETFHYKELIERGVKCRIITDSPIRAKVALEILEGVDLRVYREIGSGLSIIDKRNVFLRLSNEPKWEESHMLHINNSSIAEIFSIYFESVWLKAKQIN